MRKSSQPKLIIFYPPGGGKRDDAWITNPIRIQPHARTLRKAREQVKQMVTDGFSTAEIRCYLTRWALWWAKTDERWTVKALLTWFWEACWDLSSTLLAEGLLKNVSSRYGSTECRRSA